MSFLLRAVLAIGVLSYFAAQQRGSGGTASLAEVGRTQRAQTADVNLTGALSGLPAEMRERAARVAADEVARRLSVARASQDTLSDSDRRPSWRGPERP